MEESIGDFPTQGQSFGPRHQPVLNPVRLWSLHPKYLDTKGLLAVWREGLLAQKVLQGKTKGYRNHPQLNRFKHHASPRKSIGRYLLEIWNEAHRRGYSFDRLKVKNGTSPIGRIAVSRGQLRYEWKHLGRKLRRRDPVRFKKMEKLKILKPHPSFRLIPGRLAEWEKP